MATKEHKCLQHVVAMESRKHKRLQEEFVVSRVNDDQGEDIDSTTQDLVLTSHKQPTARFPTHTINTLHYQLPTLQPITSLSDSIVLPAPTNSVAYLVGPQKPTLPPPPRHPPPHLPPAHLPTTVICLRPVRPCSWSVAPASSMPVISLWRGALMAEATLP